MISEAEIFQIINEIHQYDVILMELKDRTIFGIVKGTESRPMYFRTRAAARTAEERRALLQGVTEPGGGGHVDPITLESLLDGLRGMKTRHVWLERRTQPSHEMAFLNLKELESFLRRHKL